MVHKKNISHSIAMHPHKPHIIPFLSYLNQLHHFLKEEDSEMLDYRKMIEDWIYSNSPYQTELCEFLKCGQIISVKNKSLMSPYL